jgi:hypothetical protein
LRKQDSKLVRKRKTNVSADQLFKAISGLQSQCPPQSQLDFKRFKHEAEDGFAAQNAAAFDVFYETKTTMREALVKVLEQKIDPRRLAIDEPDDLELEEKVDD